MRAVRYLALLLALCFVMSVGAGAVDSLSFGTGGLEGRTFLVLGDSYTAGYGLDSLEEDWTFVMAEEYGMTQLNYSISGSSFAAGPNGNYPMVERCKDLPADADLDFLILQGGSNDWYRGIPLGEDDSRDPETTCGALNLILDTLQETYPHTVIVGFTPWVSHGTPNDVGLSQQAYTDAMLRIFASRGLACYDASDTGANGMYLDREDFREQYCISIGDWFHLSAAGHAMFAPIFAQWLEDTVYPPARTDGFYDLAGAPEELKTAVDALRDDGVLNGVSAHLFAPTRAATRAQVATVLYRLAGQPEATQRTLADVSPEDPAYSAVCWGMDSGVFSPADRFFPQQLLSREMLAAVLYRYYCDYCGFVPEAVDGLGPYRDGSAVADYARTAMGWALAAGLMEDLGGALRPEGNVSRGLLAQAVYALGQLT